MPISISKFKTLAICLAVMGLTIMAYGQFPTQFQEPKTPEAYLFSKYGDVNISKYNGRHSTVIPLHTIKYGDIEIPLNISYSANGIRVDEEASRVGLGWYLNTGMISQVIQGKDDLNPNITLKIPDFYWAPYPQYAIRPYPGYYWENPTNPNDPRDPLRFDLSRATPDKDKYAMILARSEEPGPIATTLYLPHNYTNGSWMSSHQEYYRLGKSWMGEDVERDIFKASFFGHDLLFYKGNGGMRVMNNDKYKIDYHGNKWVIVTPSGMTYEFQEDVISVGQSLGTNGNGDPVIYRPSIVSGNTTSYETFHDLAGSLDLTYYKNTTSRIWKITKVIDVHGNEVVFEYEDLETIISRSSGSGQTTFKNTTVNFTSPNWSLLGVVPTPSSFDKPLDLSNSSFNSGLVIENIENNSPLIKQEVSVLKRIIFGEDKVEFGLGDRSDIPYDKNITDVNVYHKAQVVKSISLSQSYFNPNHSENTQKRLKLDSLTIDGRVYRFNYQGNFMPDKNSSAYDFWGFYNGMVNNDARVNDPFRLYENSSHIPSWGVKGLISQIDGIANRSAHPTHAQVGMLTEIIYPTGGKTKFNYELNTFDNIYFPNHDNKLNFNGNTYTTDYAQTHSQGNGLRIAETVNYTDDNTIALKTKYTYTGGKHLQPYVYKNDDNFRKVKWYYDPNIINKMVESGPSLTSYFSSIYQSMLLGNGNGVGYDRVTQETISPVDNSNNGKIVSHFTNVPDIGPRSAFGQGSSVPWVYYDHFSYSIRDTDEDNGNLIKEEVFLKNNTLLKKTEYEYQSIVPFSSENNGHYYPSYNVKAVSTGLSGGLVAPNNCGGCYSVYMISYSDWVLFYYPLKQTKTLLSKERVTNYFTNGTFQTMETDYTYNNNYLVVNKKVRDKTNTVLVEEITDYPYDMGIIGNNYSPSNISGGGTNHILTKPDKKTTKENGIVSKQYSFTYANDYTSLSSVREALKFSVSNEQMTDIFYDRYDTNGNLLEFHKENDIHTVIVWGYNKRYPVAKVENALHANVAPYIASIENASNLDNDRTLGYVGNEGQLRQLLDNLRVVLPKSMVTTYTYDPIIGITSITDPRGHTIYYEYDSHNRLKQVRDFEGNILSHNEYNYKTQNN